uniref:Uncharacterized protein n=1 Tax=Populus trichocarpa TaxID=3694 RepID=A0A3N7G049_POPTR
MLCIHLRLLLSTIVSNSLILVVSSSKNRHSRANRNYHLLRCCDSCFINC